MSDLNVLAILVAAVAAFLMSGAYYAVLGSRLGSAGPQRSAAVTAVVELVRSAVLGAAIAWLVAGLGIAGIGSALVFALVVWVAFPVVLLAGAVFHEGATVASAALHAGDWLLKLLLITGIVALWP
jgi:hypothetical protein